MEDRGLDAQDKALCGPSPGSRWRHYKGHEYEVVTCAVVEATMEVVVVYRDAGFVWTRPLAQWEEPVTFQGAPTPRFQRIP